jgi:RNA polymerase sigma-70 factor (ECF subfamily)
MANGNHEQLDERLRVLHAARDYAAVATLAIIEYGPGIFGYLAATMDSRSDATEVYGTFSEDLWRGLPSFQWASSLRTWAYVLARNAMHRYHRAPHQRSGRALPLSEAGLAEVVERSRSQADYYLRSTFKDRFAELRRRLSEEERTLLTLRVDRDMRWDEVAEVLGDERAADGTVAKAAIDRRKKQFERVKKRLHAWAAEAGLLPEKERQ